MKIVTGTAETLSAAMLFDMAHYRYRVFVQMLGWKLQPRERLELDRFDRRDTRYVLALDDSGSVRGMARLLPTERPYLLADEFPELLGGQAAMRSASVWELSRFAAIDPDAPRPADARFGASADALALLDSVMKTACAAGVHQLVTVSPLGIERMLARAGITATRLAPPVRLGPHALFACRIELAPSLAHRAHVRA